MNAVLYRDSTGVACARVAIVACLLGACSLATVGYPPAKDPGSRPIACTRSRLAPAVDFVIAAALAATAASGAIDDGSGPLPITAAFFVFSGASGMRDTGRCRELGSTLGASNVVMGNDTDGDVTEPIRRIDPPPPDATGRPRATQELGPTRTPPVQRPRQRPMVNVPDEVVVRALNTMQSAFIACFKRASRLDPGMGSTRVKVHLELDPAGGVVVVQTDTDDWGLARCLGVVAKQLPFPPPGAPAVVDFPLFFKPGE